MAILPVGIGPTTGYNIERSLRFNSADSAYLNRTQVAGTSTRIVTWSGWVKRSKLSIGAYAALFSAGTSTTDTLTFNNSGDTLRLFLNGASGADLVTTQQFRDVSAWYHILLAIDTTQATAANRVKIYVNGSQITAFSTATYPSQNYDFTDLNINGLTANIGSIGAGSYFDGYIAETYFIDGQALTPTSFGENNPNTGVWQPKKYTGTYGTNGFYLNFSDNSGTTATTLGKDYSGNGNNWTPNNFSVTAGAGNDSLVDTPTPYGTDTGVGGEVRGNYATLNPIGSYNSTISNGNLYATGSGTQRALSTIWMSSGKWYFEYQPATIGTVCGVGIIKEGASLSSATVNATEYFYRTNGQTGNNGAYAAYGASYTTSDTVGVALDLDAGTLVFYKNGVSQGTAFSSLSGSFAAMHVGFVDTNAANINFGQRPFAYTPPAGFRSLCTTNLPTPTIGATSTTQAGKYFNTVLYTGTGSSLSVTGVGFQPDFVWLKNRSQAYGSRLADAVRGANKSLVSNSTDAEVTDSPFGYVSSLNADGFTVTAGSTSAWASNNSGDAFVAWNWKGGGTGVTNTSGTITSTVSANTTSGFSIVTYTGNNTANQSVGHGLGVAPSLIIVKNRDTAATSWVVYHSSVGIGKYLELNKTDTPTTNAAFFDQVTSTVFGFDAGGNFINENGKNYIAYCFAAVAGYSAFGSYTGNGSTDGPFVFTNHRPAFLLIKRTDTTGNWTILDLAREGYNVDNDPLYPNLANAEGTTDLADILSNGFKLRSTDASVNASGGTYIYMSLASNPFKYALAR